MKSITAYLGLALLLLLSGCVAVQPYDYSQLQQEAPHSILVMPPVNNSIEVDASYTYLSVISRPLAEQGYYVFPVSVVDQLLKENGLPTPVEMNSIPLDKIRQHIGADAVLYVTISDWGQKYTIFSSTTVVKAQVKLISAKTGALLWDANVAAERGSDSGGNGLVGALVSAALTQITSSITDHTPELARVANHAALDAEKRGLLYGPYKILPETK